MVLGVSDRARYNSQELVLEPMDTLVLYTDGVTEAMNSEGAFFGNDGLIELLAESHNQHAQQIAEQLRDKIIEFSATKEPADDLTTVVLKRLE